jgi:carbon-monoxide dehydrogenase medium subunit
VRSGASPSDAASVADEGTDPPGDTNASSEFRRHLASVLVRRALEEATS